MIAFFKQLLYLASRPKLKADVRAQRRRQVGSMCDDLWCRVDPCRDCPNK